LNLQRAIEIAVEAHTGQVDKAGNLYVLHPLRVMMSLDTEDEKIAGVLHDVVEDCEGWTWDRLRSEGFSDKIIEALQSVSKTPEEEAEFRLLPERLKLESYLLFIGRVVSNDIGKKVKIADIIDNLDESRIGEIGERDEYRLDRYRRSLKILLESQ
jgi:(p)ppGpp synthase/HD superfamily hydrolase